MNKNFEEGSSTLGVIEECVVRAPNAGRRLPRVLGITFQFNRLFTYEYVSWMALGNGRMCDDLSRRRHDHLFGTA